MKVLVIGSKGHDRAHCVDWLAPFPNIEEKDAVIVDLRSLDQRTLDAILDKYPNKLDSLIGPLFTLLGTGRNVYCVTKPRMTRTPPPGAGQALIRPPDSNYYWIPLPIAFQNKEGDSIESLALPEFENYYKLVTKWNLEILGFYGDDAQIHSSGSFYTDYFRGIEPPSKSSIVHANLLPIALNKSKKPVGAQIMFDGASGSIFLLPETTKGAPEEGIETILDLVFDKKPEPKPRWWASVDVPGLGQVQKDLERLRQEIAERESKLKVLEEKKTKIELYRDVVSASGEDLESVVQKVLQNLEIETDKTPPGFPADLLKERIIAVEVTGIADKVNSDNDKMFQLQRFADDHQKGEKLVLVANTYRRLEPSARKGKMDFTPEVEKYFSKRKVCALTSLTLLELWRLVDADPSKKAEVQNRIFETDGELKL